jgi:hypothetical protein
MSQAGIINTGGASGGDVLTLTGNTGGAVGPNGSGNINVVFPTAQPGAGTVTGNPGANTLTINAWQTVSTTTVNAATSNLYTLAIPNDTAITINALISAVTTDFARSGAGVCIVGAVNDAGTVTIIGAPGVSFAVSPEGNVAGVNVAISGSNLEIQVTGEAGHTYGWTALVYYVTNT